jgi:hypothetical protein
VAHVIDRWFGGVLIRNIVWVAAMWAPARCETEALAIHEQFERGEIAEDAAFDLLFDLSNQPWR